MTSTYSVRKAKIRGRAVWVLVLDGQRFDHRSFASLADAKAELARQEAFRAECAAIARRAAEASS